MPVHLEQIRSWLDEQNRPDRPGRDRAEEGVPVHRHSIWYYLGGMTLFLFAVQVATGILLLLYYRPSAEEAYESVQFLMAEVQFGWLVRSIHAWSANLMIFSLFLHLVSVLLLQAYRPPREMTWLSGIALLGLALALGFTGYLLPWNMLAFFATRVGTDIPGAVPVVGDFIRMVLRGGEDVTGATLTRFYGIHVAVLPALTTACLALHLYLVQRHGMSVPLGIDGSPSERRMPFLPNFLLRDLIGWLVALAVLASLAAFFPTELGEKADPFASAPAEHPARVVLHVHVPDAEAAARTRDGHRGGDVWHPGVRDGWPAPGARAFSRSGRGTRRTQSPVDVPVACARHLHVGVHVLRLRLQHELNGLTLFGGGEI